MSPGHLVKSSLGDIVGQDPLIAFSKHAFVVLKEKLPKSVNSYPGNERIPLTLETLTTFPSVFSRWGTASIVKCNTARTLVAITLSKNMLDAGISPNHLSYCSRLVVSIVPISSTPALFTWKCGMMVLQKEGWNTKQLPAHPAFQTFPLSEPQS